MLFNSLQFLVFFMVVTLIYYRAPNQRMRVGLLLVASCYFYMCFVPKYILILGTTIVIDYIAGIQIAIHQGKARKAWLVLSILANAGILAFFKYFNFVFGNLEPLIHWFFPHKHVPVLDIILPIGLSFHTFQAMSYTIEVYRGKQAPERDFAIYALYVMFYPQLVAGPIERPQHVLPQLHRYQDYQWTNVKEGISRMFWGFFKKVVIADRLALGVDYIFNHRVGSSSGCLAVGALLYSFQIYCDFSGYSDIAIGAAKVMGIRLMENFNEPYASGNIPEFWSRWHISLSSWFRDYVYIPLGGNRLGEWRRKLNILIVFLLSGLWHGANWTFVAWGGLHGLLTAFYPGHWRERKKPGRFKGALMVGVNFILVTLLWVFFRSASMGQALAYLGGIFCLRPGSNRFGLNTIELLVSLILVVIMLFREYRFSRHQIGSNRAFAVYCLIMTGVCYFLGVFDENQFIYFQF